jgi:AraC family transcriptional regulator
MSRMAGPDADLTLTIFAQKEVGSARLTAAHSRFHRQVKGKIDCTASHAYVMLQPRPYRHTWSGDFCRRGQLVGDVSFAPEGHVISTRSLPGDQHVLSVRFSKDLSREIGFAEKVWPIADVKNRTVRNLFELLWMETFYPGLSTECLCSHLLSALAIELSREFAPKTEGDRMRNSRDHRVRRVIECIEENLASELTIRFIAENCGIGERQLARSFKRATGITVWEHVSARRLERAKNMLMVPGARIKDVSHSCGFRSAAAFSSSFHISVGVSPAEFRRNCQS